MHKFDVVGFHGAAVGSPCYGLFDDLSGPIRTAVYGDTFGPPLVEPWEEWVVCRQLLRLHETALGGLTLGLRVRVVIIGSA